MKGRALTRGGDATSGKRSGEISQSRSKKVEHNRSFLGRRVSIALARKNIL